MGGAAARGVNEPACRLLAGDAGSCSHDGGDGLLERGRQRVVIFILDVFNVVVTETEIVDVDVEVIIVARLAEFAEVNAGKIVAQSLAAEGSFPVRLLSAHHATSFC